MLAEPGEVSLRWWFWRLSSLGRAGCAHRQLATESPLMVDGATVPASLARQRTFNTIRWLCPVDPCYATIGPAE